MIFVCYLICMLLHVAECKFISIQQLEGLIVQIQPSSHIQILSCEILGHLTLKQLLAWLLHLTSL